MLHHARHIVLPEKGWQNYPGGGSSRHHFEIEARCSTIPGEKLDAFAKARTAGQGKPMMINAIRSDMENRFGGATPDNIPLALAYTYDEEAAAVWKREIEEAFPGFEVHMDPLSLSVSCHIGPGAIAVGCCKKLDILRKTA